MTSPTVSDMSQDESIRKLMQLRPVIFEDNTRGFVPEDVRATDLSFAEREAKVDTVTLIPFLVSALQNIEKRLEAVEARVS